MTGTLQRVCAKANTKLVRRLNRCFECLCENPFYHPNIKALKGNMAGLYRYQIGKWRVIYEPDEEECVIYILQIIHRGKAYR